MTNVDFRKRRKNSSCFNWEMVKGKRWKKILITTQMINLYFIFNKLDTSTFIYVSFYFLSHHFRKVVLNHSRGFCGIWQNKDTAVVRSRLIKSLFDNINRMITPTGLSYLVIISKWDFKKSDNNKRLPTLTVITLSIVACFRLNRIL